MEIASTSGAGHDPPLPTADQQGGRTDQEKRQWRRPKRNVEQQQGNPRGPSDDSRPSAPRDGRPPNQRNPRNPTTQSGQNAASWRATTPAGVVDDAHPVQKDDSRSRNYRQRKSRPTYQDSGASTPSSSTVVSNQSEQQPTAPPGVVDNVASAQRENYRPRNRGQPKPRTADREIGTSTTSASTVVSSQSEQQPTALPSDGLPTQRNNYRSRNPRQQKPKPTNQEIGSIASSSSTAVSSQPGQHPPRRGAKFGGRLTQPEPSTSGTRPTDKYKTKAGPIGDDLASTLIHALSTPPYPDCPICFSPIHPAQPTWSCSPSTPTIVGENEEVQYCWTTFHVKCIRSWASKSVKDIADAWRARGEERNGDWRCPGCQSKREEVPSGYWCFCNSTPEPKPPRLSTPHSCGGPCSRPRESGCGHACPLQCHPGPCPPCQITTRLECYCPHKKILSFRCGIDGKGKGKAKRDLTCGNVCGRTLGCGKHACAGICHEDDCAKCALREMVRCWCGKEEKEVACGEGEPVECSVEGETPWIGRFGCDNVCARFFDCGIHKCEKPCHQPSHHPSTCPRSPSNITHCPCGRSTIAPSPSAERSQYTFAARTSCSDPIPTCTSTCSKPHDLCSHPCKAKCHTGPCPPCTVEITRPCRCGGTTRSLSCYQIHDTEESEILCDRPCTALRACGRHQCRRVCCPLASLAGTSGKKGKRRAGDNDGPGIGEEPGGLHECDLTCEKMLSCGNHRCEERDHKGPCPPCLRSSFEEMACFCGRTVLEPPISCGTRIQCHYPCSRPPLPCGHPGTTHSCHEDPSPCPPCPFLTSKQCACGKKFVANVRCSLERVSCGTTCGKLMACGFHHCESLCHADDCGPCTAPCGKNRKVCLPNHHPCTQPCHAPSSCPETEPCMATVTLTCPCERIKQFAPCGRQASHTSGYQHAALKCTSECQIAKRNAQLADALGIRADGKDKAAGTTYHEQLVAFGRANVKFLQVVEKAFAEFISSDKRTQVLPHMPPERRKFVHDLASVYRMDTQMVDQEPHRSVQLLRRVDTRVPSPLLSNVIATSAPPPSLGKLADLRTLKSGGAQSPSWRPALAPTPKPAQSAAGGPSRGWTSVVARPSSTPLAAPKPTASLGGLSSASLGASAGVHARTPTPTHVAARRETPVDRVPPSSNNPVPDNWEDDV